MIIILLKIAVLPSGVCKLQDIHEPPEVRNQPNMKAALGNGLNGEISPSDYAYTSLLQASWALKAKMVDNRPEKMWMTAEKLDPNECVVIDFRSMKF